MDCKVDKKMEKFKNKGIIKILKEALVLAFDFNLLNP